MNTVPEPSQQQEAEQYLRSLKSFPQRARFIAYQRVFAEAFPKMAPRAMGDLLSLKPLVMEWARREQGSSERKAAQTQLVNAVSAWCRANNIDTHWVWVAGTLTVICAAFNSAYGQSAPERLITSVQPIIAEADNKLFSLFEEIDLEPVADIAVHVRSDPYIWQPLSETPSQFRVRAQREFLQRLDEELTLASSVTNISPVDVNHQWVDWLILRQVGKRSERSVANQFGVSRPAVNKGVKKAREELYLPAPSD